MSVEQVAHYGDLPPSSMALLGTKDQYGIMEVAGSIPGLIRVDLMLLLRLFECRLNLGLHLKSGATKSKGQPLA